MKTRRTIRIYASTNNKGGVGKTTTAINLAYGLSRKLIDPDGEPTGHVLIVDLDPQGNVADALGVRDQVFNESTNPDGACISQLFLGEKDLRDVLISANNRPEVNRPNLFVLPASRALEQATSTLVLQNMQAILSGEDAVPVDEVLEVHLADALQVFDFIVLDCPPKLDTLKKAVYRFADEAIVPVQAHYLATVGATQHTQDILEMQERGIDIEIGMLVPTVFDGRQLMAKDMHKSIQRAFGQNMVATPIPNNVDVKEAPGRGLSVLEYAPDSIGGVAYQELVDRIFANVRQPA